MGLTPMLMLIQHVHLYLSKFLNLLDFNYPIFNKKECF